MTFQMMMNKIFTEEIQEGHIVIYLNDILIFSDDLDAHCALVAWVLQKLRLHKLYLKPKKCEFEKATVNYLGMIVSGGNQELGHTIEEEGPAMVPWIRELLL